MSLASYYFRKMCKKSDKKRDSSLKIPESVTVIKDLPYEKGGKYNLLDINYPKGTSQRLPVIVSIHGGGFVYGTKEVYVHYCAYLATLGFVVVNFNYHLAPGLKFPGQLGEINQVFQWIEKNADQYYMDLNNVFIVGDSAGANLCSQYANIYTNPDYAKLFDIVPPAEPKIRAIAVNCGLYSMEFKNDAGNVVKSNGLMKDYLGKTVSAKNLERLDMMGHISASYPPTFVMTSEYDFLKDNAKPFYDFLQSKNIKSVMKKYGEPGQEYMAHVFHVNMNLEEAKICNQEETAFFREHMV